MSLAGFRYSTAIILPDTSEVKDKDTQLELSYVFNALRTLAAHVDKITGALSPLQTDWPQYIPDGAFAATHSHKIYAQCIGAVPFGAMINLFGSGGVLYAKTAKADGFANAAAGFCNTPGGFAHGEIGEFICGPGINEGIGGLVIGTWYFLDPTTTSGQITATQPVAAGQIIQLCGIAIATNRLLCGAFNNWIQL